MKCNWRSNRFSALFLLPWLAFLAILEQGLAIQFYPDANFAQEAELVTFNPYTGTVLSLEDLSTPEHSAVTSIEYPPVTLILSNQAPPLSPFTHLHARALVVSWIQARSQGYRQG